MAITPNTLKSFADQGFVALQGFLQPNAVLEMLENIERFVHDTLPVLPPNQIYYEDKTDLASLKQIQQLGEHDEYFRQLQHESEFRRVAEQLLGGPVVPKNMQYFNKPPLIGRPTPPHQDGYYFMLDPCEAVTMWLALDIADEENGCVRYVPGSHTTGLRNHERTTTLGFSQGIADYPTIEDAKTEVALLASPGGLLVHHAMTIHRADGNPSQRSRRALGFIYYSERAKEDAVAHAAYQKNLADELRTTEKI